MDWQIDGKPVAWEAIDGKLVSWKIMVVTQDGIYFSGKESLVRDPKEAQWFDNYSEAVDRTKEIGMYLASGVKQVRLISSAFAESQ